MNTLTRKMFSESTMLTALIAATPEELIIAMLMKFRQVTKAWSTSTGRKSRRSCRQSMASPVKCLFRKVFVLLRSVGNVCNNLPHRFRIFECVSSGAP